MHSMLLSNDFLPSWDKWAYTGDESLSQGVTFYRTDNIKFGGWAEYVEIINLFENFDDYPINTFAINYGSINFDPIHKKGAYQTAGLDTSKRQSKFNLFNAYFWYGITHVHSTRVLYVRENDLDPVPDLQLEVEVISLEGFKNLLNDMSKSQNFI